MAQWRKVSSFSSSLLDAIDHSIDQQIRNDEVENHGGPRKPFAGYVEEEIESLRRDIRIEKWMDQHYSSSSHSGSSKSDSSMFSSSETESSSYSAASRTTPKFESTIKGEWRIKSRALNKIYEELKKVKEPISPGRKIANFFNSIFTNRRNVKKTTTRTREQDVDEWRSINLRKSRSVRDTNTTTASRSCLTKNQSYRGYKSKQQSVVKFCHVNDEDCKTRHGRESLNGEKIQGTGSPFFMKKNMGSFGFYGDDRSCSGSDLFELDIIGYGRKGSGDYSKELPVFGTTSLKINQAIANGFVM